jgi:ABC-type transport system involved in multi-copper enzyme maturation permease subunit
MRRAARPPFPFALLRFWLLRILPAWGGIALLIFLVQIGVSGIVHDNEKVKTFLAFLDALPSIVKSALGGEMLQFGNTAGLIAIGYNHPFVLFLFMLFAVGTPTGLLAGEVQRGTMELILSRSITKTQVYACAGILTLGGMFALDLVMFLGTVVAVHLFTFPDHVPLDVFFRIAINGGLLASTFGAFSLLCAGTFGRLYAAIGVSVAFLVLNYFVAVLANWWPRLAFLKRATLFYLIDSSHLWQGWPVRNLLLLAALLLAAAGVGAVIWHRRDLPL